MIECFRDYWHDQRPVIQAWIARRCNTTPEYLQSLASGSRKPGKQFRLLLELICGKKFRFPADD